MALKREPEKHPNHERWLVSYGDLLTLLLAVFVVLYAMSLADKKKVEEVAESLRESFGYSKASLGAKPVVIDSGNISIVPSIKPQSLPVQQRQAQGKQRAYAMEKDFGTIKASLDAYLTKSGNRGKVSIDITRRGLVVSLKEAGFFDSGSARIKAGSEELFSVIAQSLSHYANPYRIEGHTDNVPIHTGQFRSNWELSTMRATNVLQKLVDSYGFDPAAMSAAGYGEYRSVADNGAAEGRAKNRRVDIVMLSSGGEAGEPVSSGKPQVDRAATGNGI
ncbi:flagellar motor protein MotB [Oryzomonas rubra]|uniref:Flagellar basal body stator protein MotB n=1 Tax=Oryzomonas rubra TaxID=2509454 RepID=A0A5A9XI20_9BACT|nr:flagellar motor protein MotB [Oryzomonas rubra]KAA0892145.1 flagellar basal body stator protein MotB [Oryzomonas rubra]